MSTQCLFWALKTKVGNPTRKLVLLVLSDIANEEGRCWPGHDYIAERAECSRRCVIEHLNALHESGHIKIDRRFENGQQQPNVYTIGGVQNLHSGGVQKTARGGAESAHNTPIDTPIYINKDSWAEWVEYRKQAKKKITPATAKKQQAFLAQYTPAEQSTVINQSIQNGWAGLFPPKEQSHATHRPARNPGTAGRKPTPAERVHQRHAEIYGSDPATETPVMGAVVAIQ